MFFTNKQYYYGISVPKGSINYDLWLPSKSSREDKAGNIFLEWKGFGNKNELKSSNAYTKFITENNLFMTIADRIKGKKTTDAFLDLMEGNVEFNQLMEKTNGQGIFKEINVGEAYFGGKFDTNYFPVFKFKSVEDGVFSGGIHKEIKSEEFNRLDDYKNMKLLEPLLVRHIKQTLNETAKVEIVKSEYGWRYDITIINNSLFGMFINKKKPLINLNLVFTKDLDVNITYDEYLKYYMNDENFFSYYNYKSGALESISSTFKFITIGPAEVFYKTHLMKPWEIV